MNDEHTGSQTGIDRRQLLKASAWAAPVLVLATAAPAAAASPADYLTLTVAEFRLIEPLNNPAEYRFDFRVTSPVMNDSTGGDVLTVTVEGFGSAPYVGTISGGGFEWTGPDGGPAVGVRPGPPRGQEAQGRFDLPVVPGTTPTQLSGRITITAQITNANGQRSNVVTATA